MKVTSKPPRLVRRIQLLRRLEFRYTAYIDKKNKARYNDTPIPHQIDYFLGNRFLTDFDHRNFTGLYFKHTPYYGHFKEVLIYCTISAGPSRAIDFIKTLSDQSKDKLAFYRQIKFEFTYFLNRRILNTSKESIELFANTIMGEKIPKVTAEFIAREVLTWSEKFISQQESIKDVSNSKLIAIEGTKKDQNSSIGQEDEIIQDIKELPAPFSWKDYKGWKKDFLMFCLIPYLTGALHEKPGFTKKLYLNMMARFFNVELPKHFDNNIESAIENGSYHEILSDLIAFVKRYEKNFDIDQKKRDKNWPSGIKY